MTANNKASEKCILVAHVMLLKCLYREEIFFCDETFL